MPNGVVMNCVLDVWAGEGMGDHVARYLRPVILALAIAGQELAAGNLCNLRADVAWGEEQEFDLRGQS